MDQHPPQSEKQAKSSWEPGHGGESAVRYRRLWVFAALSSGLVSLLPLIIMAATNYYQYQKAFEKEVRHPILLSGWTVRRSLRFFIEERSAALKYIIHARTLAELNDQATLSGIFRNLNNTYSGFVDLGVIDAEGRQTTYVGPYRLHDRSYKSHPWFNEALLRGMHISDVFLGYRKFPHFVIAVRNESDDGRPYVLRATLNADIIERVLEMSAPLAGRDTFIINAKGVLQTPSRNFGRILTRIPLSVPPDSDDVTIREERDQHGEVLLVGTAHIEKTPFIFMDVERQEALLESWFTLRTKLMYFMAISIVLIVVVVLAGSTYLVNRIREAETRRIALLHKVEYTAKMATIGRLAAGVAHEVNNPLAIINEKAGLLKDLINFTEDFPHKKKFERHIDPIISSVDRCSRITRRLLRFARHIDVRLEPIDLGNLLREVLGFLEKESLYRSINVSVTVEEDVPVIESDRGRLQQVFLNIVNNAFAAVSDGGQIKIQVAQGDPGFVVVSIEDNGSGISEENLAHIFEPFFTTKEQHGTGLGLSITYGIVGKLGGRIGVESVEGEWTRFSVVLPVKSDAKGVEDGSDPSAIGG